MRAGLGFAIGWLVGAAALAERPNVLFIAVDDLRPELGCYGSRAVTPNIDRLAGSGLKFSRAYCNQAVCGASRVSLMTGLYPEKTGERTYHVRDWRERWDEVVTLNQHFKANGYATVGLGKIYHEWRGPDADEPNWSEWRTVDGRDYADPENQEARRRAREQGGKRGPATEVSEAGDEFHFDGRRATLGARLLGELAAAEEPFFLAVGFTKPHLPFVAPRKYWELYERESFSMPPNLGVPPGYPDYARNKNAGELRHYGDIPGGPLADFPDELNRRLIHGYHACASYVDRNIGVLLEALEESGAADDTIVVLWADHGWKLGDHSSWCKHTNFECDTRVPLVVRDPRMASARGESMALVELVDLYPTLCELTGLDAPQHLQGESFAAVMRDPGASHREFAYSSYPHGDVVGHSIRTPRHRYTEWWKKDGDRVVESVLTELVQDPGETTAVEGEEGLKEELSKVLGRRVRSVRE